MSPTQLLVIVSAVLFHVRDKNPPHGVYESQNEAIARAIVTAKTLIAAVGQAGSGETEP